ncbi:MAG TPA: c-type cytochrome [Flavitalea sp.]|nr:c-type cytochrome [Flavitalea sp.]
MKTRINTFISATASVLLIITLIGCNDGDRAVNTKIEDVAGSEEALNFMRTFNGRGTLTDSSRPAQPLDALAMFRYPDDLALDLVLAEPKITQPVYINFDHRGRLWVVQYNQYPYPKGVKVMSMDQHMRAEYDKALLPPPQGTRGADKISFFEDTDGDGKFDKAVDAITGLNIATSVEWGRGQIWVLDPPYLLAYPDPDQDGIPDGDPVVHLKGFGIEDTHAVANNLRWGPDGWLYGAQGSTCTADVSSAVSRNIRFNGQAIWRYHPETQVFEIYAEGGGNTFDVEIDDKGRIYSGDNGSTHGRYYKQGAYHVRNLGKHGAFTNPYAFGYLPDMEHVGDTRRFTHAFIRYGEQNLPENYRDKMISLNPLQRFVQLSGFEPKGSSFKNVDEGYVLQTDDRWFRPVDMAVGPDGGVYIADWYDSRLSHVDPRDTWSKSTGRIYRLSNKNKKEPAPKLDISAYSNEALVQLLSHKSRWFRQQALRQLGDRKDASVVPLLIQGFLGNDAQTALEALWGIHLSGGLTDTIAMTALAHKDPYVRMWAVRLLGDNNRVSPAISAALSALALSEPHPEVRSQLAATAKRLPAEQALPVVKNLLKGHDDVDDPDIPLQIWWALESKSVSDREAILTLFKDKTLWNSPTVLNTILGRLMQRYAIEGGAQDFTACARLIKMAPSAKQGKLLVEGLQEGLRGKSIAELPADLSAALKPFQAGAGGGSLTLALRQGQRKAIEKALAIIGDDRAEIGERLAYIRVMGEINEPGSVPVLLKIMESGQSSSAIKQAALAALPRYDDPKIGERTVKAYPDRLRADLFVRNASLLLLATRASWANQLLDAIDRKKQAGEKFVAHTIDRSDLPPQIINQLILLNDPKITETTHRLWPEAKPVSSADKASRIEQASAALRSGSGDIARGRLIFSSLCGSCHRLFDEGGAIGPDLTGYDRTNISDLLNHIIDPGVYIREGYAAYHVRTSDNRSLLGTIKERSGSTVVIQPFNGEQITLSMDQVTSMEPQKISIMPERLMDGLSDQQVRDMVAYIMKNN